MPALLLSALGLGLAGLDPTGALLLVAALAAGASRRGALAFGLVALLGTVVLGTALSRTLGRRLADVRWLDLLPGGALGVALELGLAAALVAWAVRRLRGRSGPRRGRSVRPRRSPLRLAAVGTLFAASAATDPAFLAVVVVAGREDAVAATAAAHLVWALVSQAPLVVVLAAVAAGAHERAVTAFQRGWSAVRAPVGHVVTGALLVAAAFLVADAGAYAVTRRFLVE